MKKVIHPDPMGKHMTKRVVTEEGISDSGNVGHKIAENKTVVPTQVNAEQRGKKNLDIIMMIQKIDHHVHPNISHPEHPSIILIDFDRKLSSFKILTDLIH